MLVLVADVFGEISSVIHQKSLKHSLCCQHCNVPLSNGVILSWTVLYVSSILALSYFSQFLCMLENNPFFTFSGHNFHLHILRFSLAIDVETRKEGRQS